MVGIWYVFSIVNDHSCLMLTALITIEAILDAENIQQPEYSQPLTTALQLALFELLKSLGTTPKYVVGHSSGEIAAA
jgi:acyl transferase domain-containing protein